MSPAAVRGKALPPTGPPAAGLAPAAADRAVIRACGLPNAARATLAQLLL